MIKRNCLLLATLIGFSALCSADPLVQWVSANEAFCPSGISDDVCNSYLGVIKTAASKKPESAEEFRRAISDVVSNTAEDPEFWSGVLASPSLSNAIGNFPVTLNFKVFDSESSESVIGLEFSYFRNINKTTYDDKGNRELSYQMDFSVNGTVTQNADENPKDFINAKMGFSGSSKPSFNLKQVVAGLSSYCYDDPDAVNNDPECARLIEINDVNKFFEPIGSAYYLDYGVSAGFEADQSLSAKNQVVGIFTFLAYEDFRRDTFIGHSNIKPSLYFAVESVKPNNEAPRAVAGDDSEYYRVSTDFSLVVPMKKIANVPYSLMFSYRTYDEINASAVVKEAKLDAYRLRTYSLVAPKGMFVSYSSGKLPFGVDDENIVELGYKTYF